MRTVISRLKSIKQTPPNGLAVFCGLVDPKNLPTLFSHQQDASDFIDAGEQGGSDASHVDLKKICVMIEPPLSPIQSNLYYCDDCFHVEQLKEQLQDFSSGKKYGVIVVTGQGTLYGTCRGNTYSIIHQFSVELPNKHGRGGQSALRFSRNRDIAKEAYLKQIAEKTNSLFISPTLNTPIVDGIVIAGSADLKNELISLKSDQLDYRLRNKILTVVDVAYGGKPGFMQAISLAQEAILDAKYVEERACVQELLTALTKGNKVVCGLEETMFAIQSGWADKVVICETQTTLKKVTFSDNTVKYMNEGQIKNHVSNGAEVVKVESLVDHLVDNYEKMGINDLSLVTACTNEGTMFVSAFDGIGAMLKFDVNVSALLAEEHSASMDQIYEEDLADFY